MGLQPQSHFFTINRLISGYKRRKYQNFLAHVEKKYYLCSRIRYTLRLCL